MFSSPIFFLILSGLLSFLPSAAQQQPTNNTDSHTRIAFGSCSNQFDAQPLWDEVVNSAPDLWVWLGDNIYADTDDMSQLKRFYQHQLRRPDYRRLLQACPVTGIWDDHDYAGDNADRRFPHKKQSQQLFLDFMGIPEDAPVRRQEGIYRSYTLGRGDRKVKILLLDGLYHRDPYKSLFGLYLPNRTGDILGEAQWQWLEKELTASDAKVHIIASGLQVLPTSNIYTNWSVFPAARERLLRLIEKTRPAIPIILSGDRHVGELSSIELQGYNYPLYEVTSSGMTHHRRARRAGNRHRVGEQIGALNFGILHINWEKNYTSVTMQIRGEENKLYLERTVKFLKD